MDVAMCLRSIFDVGCLGNSQPPSNVALALSSFVKKVNFSSKRERVDY